MALQGKGILAHHIAHCCHGHSKWSVIIGFHLLQSARRYRMENCPKIVERTINSINPAITTRVRAGRWEREGGRRVGNSVYCHLTKWGSKMHFLNNLWAKKLSCDWFCCDCRALQRRHWWYRHIQKQLSQWGVRCAASVTAGGQEPRNKGINALIKHLEESPRKRKRKQFKVFASGETRQNGEESKENCWVFL